VKLTCSCKLRKVELTCKKVRDEKITNVECDEKCEAAKKRMEQEKLEQKMKLKEIEEEKNRKELEEYEKKLGKKKYKERKQRQVNEDSDSGMMKIYIGIGFLTAIIAIILYFLIQK
jgi:NF-X1-type zinc finger protein NFXL1